MSTTKLYRESDGKLPSEVGKAKVRPTMFIDDIFCVASIIDGKRQEDDSSGRTCHICKGLFGGIGACILQSCDLARQATDKMVEGKISHKNNSRTRFCISEQAIDDSLRQGNEDETPSVEVNFDALNSAMDENHTNGLYTEITQFVKSSILTDSWTKLAAQACATMKQVVTDKIDPCDLANFCSLLDVVIRRTIDVSMVELCNDCCLVLFLPNKTFKDVPCMVGILPNS